MKDDLISRQVALSALNGRKTAEKSALGNARNTVVDWCVDAIKALPPAQLAQDLPKGCTDTISRAAVLDLIEQSCCDLEYDCDNVALRKEVEALSPVQPDMETLLKLAVAMAKPIEYLNLSVRSYNALKRRGVDSVAKVYELKQKENLKKIRNIGAKSADEIEDCLSAYLAQWEGGQDNGAD